MSRRRSTKKPRRRSGYEDRVEASLRSRSITYEYETEKFRYIVERTYTPDFVFRAVRLIVECKGRFTSSDRSKMLKTKPIIEAAGWRIALLFQNARRPLYKGSKTSYGEWATKHGFLWAEGITIPKRWIC